MGYGPIKADRDVIGWLLLSIVTCGIYSYYFLYCLARDINVMNIIIKNTNAMATVYNTRLGVRA